MRVCAENSGAYRMQVSMADGGGDFVSLLEQVGAHVGQRLLPVPGTSVGCSQATDQVDQRLEIGVRHEGGKEGGKDRGHRISGPTVLR